MSMLEDFNWGKYEGRVANVSVKDGYVHADIDGVPSDVKITPARQSKYEAGTMSEDAVAISTLKGYLKEASSMTLGMYNATQGDKRPAYPDPVVSNGNLVWNLLLLGQSNPIYPAESEYAEYEKAASRNFFTQNTPLTFKDTFIPIAQSALDDLRQGKVTLDAVAGQAWEEASKSAPVEKDSLIDDMEDVSNVVLEGRYVNATVYDVPTKLFIPDRVSSKELSTIDGQKQVARELLTNYKTACVQLSSTEFNRRQGDPTAAKGAEIRGNYVASMDLTEAKTFPIAEVSLQDLHDRKTSVDAVALNANQNFRNCSWVFPGLSLSDYDALTRMPVDSNYFNLDLHPYDQMLPQKPGDVRKQVDVYRAVVAANDIDYQDLGTEMRIDFKDSALARRLNNGAIIFHETGNHLSTMIDGVPTTLFFTASQQADLVLGRASKEDIAVKTILSYLSEAGKKGQNDFNAERGLQSFGEVGIMGQNRPLPNFYPALNFGFSKEKNALRVPGFWPGLYIPQKLMDKVDKGQLTIEGAMDTTMQEYRKFMEKINFDVSTPGNLRMDRLAQFNEDSRLRDKQEVHDNQSKSSGMEIVSDKFETLVLANQANNHSLNR